MRDILVHVERVAAAGAAEDRGGGAGLGHELFVAGGDVGFFRGGFDDEGHFFLDAAFAGLLEILGGRVIRTFEETLGVLEGHGLDGVEEDAGRLQHGGLGGAVHGADKVIGEPALTEGAERLFHGAQFFRLRDFHVHVVQVAAVLAQIGDGALHAFGQRLLEAGDHLVLRERDEGEAGSAGAVGFSGGFQEVEQGGAGGRRGVQRGQLSGRVGEPVGRTGLDEVIVHAGVGALADFPRHGGGRHADDARTPAAQPVLADAARGFESVQFRHVDIHHDDVVRLAAQGGEDFEAVADHVSAIAEPVGRWGGWPSTSAMISKRVD